MKSPSAVGSESPVSMQEVPMIMSTVPSLMPRRSVITTGGAAG
jgi:hypothetical protein